MSERLKAFENWLDKKSYSQAEEKVAESAWKAALEWALEQEEWQGTDDGGCEGIDKWDIEEELNGTT